MLVAPLVLLTLAVLLSGCRDRKELTYLGKWHGRFEPTRVESQPPGSPKEIGAWRLSADLQLYVDRFLLRMDGPQQAIEVRGSWSIREGKGVTLDPKGVTFDDKGGIESRDPNLAYLAPEEVQKSLSGKIPLRQEGATAGADAKPVRLLGVESRLANIVGRLELERE